MANLNATDIEGKTALIHAAAHEADYRNDPSNPPVISGELVIIALINAKADLNVRDQSGHTALFYAKTVGTESIAKLISDAGGTE